MRGVDEKWALKSDALLPGPSPTLCGLGFRQSPFKGWFKNQLLSLTEYQTPCSILRMAQPHNPTARFSDSCKVTYTENGESGVGTEVSLTPNPTPPPCLEQILSVSLNKGPLTFKWSSSLWGQQDVARD